MESCSLPLLSPGPVTLQSPPLPLSPPLHFSWLGLQAAAHSTILTKKNPHVTPAPAGYSWEILTVMEVTEASAASSPKSNGNDQACESAPGEDHPGRPTRHQESKPQKAKTTDFSNSNLVSSAISCWLSGLQPLVSQKDAAFQRTKNGII